MLACGGIFLQRAAVQGFIAVQSFFKVVEFGDIQTHLAHKFAFLLVDCQILQVCDLGRAVREPNFVKKLSPRSRLEDKNLSR